MKKLLSLFLLSTSCFANAMSLSIEHFVSKNTFTVERAGVSSDIDNDSSGVAIKLGFESKSPVTPFIEYRNESFDLGIYDQNNDSLNYFSIGMLKDFKVSEKFMPYIQGSVGLGFMDISGYENDTANAIGTKVGGGLAYYLTENVRLHAGVDAQYRVWSSIETSTGDLDINDTSFVWNIGATYKF